MTASLLVAPLIFGGGMIGAGSAFAAPSADAAAAPLPDPFVRYTFDDADTGVVANSGSAGAALDARIENAEQLTRGTGATSATGASGVFPGAALGTSKDATPYLEVPAGVYDGAEALTVSTWIKWDGRFADQLPWAYIIGNNDLPDNWGVYYQPNEGGQSKAVANSGTEVKAVAPAPLPSDTWTQITTVVDGSTIAYYINGVLIRTEAAPVDFSTLDNGATGRSGMIGRVPWAGPYAAFFPGEFDDFTIYRDALTADQVNEVFTSYSGEITSVSQSEFDVSTPSGVNPALPGTVSVTYSSGSTLQLPITWDAVPASAYAQPGASFDVQGTIPGWDQKLVAHVTVAQRDTEKISVDLGQTTGTFRGGASGTLYGLGDEASPTQALVNGAAMTTISQKPPYGTQHPGGDVFDVEKSFFDKHGQELYVYTQDYYPDWPYTHGQRVGDDLTFARDAEGNLTGEKTAGGNGVWDYLEVLELVVDEIATKADDPTKYAYIPFNEPDWIWYSGDDKYNRYLIDGGQPDSFTPNGVSDWTAAWDVITSTYAKHGLARPKIAGPGDSVWRGEQNIKRFLTAAKAEDRIPDVYVWHELGGYVWLPDRMAEFDSYAKAVGIADEDIPQVNITEYGASTDMSSPANLLRWFASFEAAKVDAQTAYWTASGTLSDNQAKVNDANGGWWLFKWYGDMTGAQTAKVTENQTKAIAAVNDDDKRAQIVFAGIEAGRDASLEISGIDPAVFGGAVDIEVREAQVNGTDGNSGTPPVVVAEKGVAVTDGKLSLRVPSYNASTAYQVIVTPGQARDVVADMQAQPERHVIEAENTALTDAETRTPGGYRASNEQDVWSFDSVSARSDWTVDIAEAGLYRLQVLGATPGVPVQHALFVDDALNQTVQYGANAMKPSNVQSVARGSAEVLVQLSAGSHVLSLRTSADGSTLMPNAGYSSGAASGVTLDRYTLVRVGDTADTAREDYPASTFRLTGGGHLDFSDTATAGWADVAAGQSLDVYPATAESGYQDLSVTWKGDAGSTLVVTVNGRPASTFTATGSSQTSGMTVHLPEGITEVEITSATGASVEGIRTVRNAAADASITTIEAEDASVTLGGTAARKEFGTGPTDGAATNGTGSGYLTGLGITDANPANEGTFTLPRTGALAKAGEYDVVVHYSNDSIEGTHAYNPQVVDLGLQAKEGTSEELAGRSTFRYTYLATNFWDATMPLSLSTDTEPVTFGNTRHTLYIDEGPTGSTDDDRILPGYAIAPMVDRVSVAPFVLSSDGEQSTVPAAPTAPTVTVQDQAATVAWNAPSDGGSAITAYTVKVRDSQGAVVRTVTVSDDLAAANSVIVSGLAFGEYTVTVTATNAVGTSPASPASAVFTIAPVVTPAVDRVGGADRFAVSAATSQAGFPDGATTVYVASGAVFPDALSAAPAATVAGAPVLLTRGDVVPSVVQDEITRLNPDRIVIVGGTNTISAGVEKSLAGIAEVTRIGGADRFEASRNIAKSAFPDGADVAVLATGATFPDALSAGAAVNGRGPVILVSGAASGLDAATKELLGTLGVEQIVIAGGPASVSTGVENDAAAIADTVRLGGADRFAASRSINDYFFDTADRVLLATGSNFPDALSGSAFAPTIDAPLFTVHGDCIPAETLAQITALGAKQVTLLGGPNTLSPAVESLTTCPAQ